MSFQEPKFRCGGNWDELANLFDYEISPSDQDWTYTSAEPNKIDDYIHAYDTKVKNEDTKFSLMEMILQALTDQENGKLMNEKWNDVEALLTRDFKLHEYTIYYWCSWENDDINDCWEITPLIRNFYMKAQQQ